MKNSRGRAHGPFNTTADSELPSETTEDEPKPETRILPFACANSRERSVFNKFTVISVKCTKICIAKYYPDAEFARISVVL